MPASMYCLRLPDRAERRDKIFFFLICFLGVREIRKLEKKILLRRSRRFAAAGGEAEHSSISEILAKIGLSVVV